ncbi:hypothetical protein L4X63_00445 [Geomonas sp. Red32]|nr:hypothetical protein [Geomonas sp. Red32]
MRSIYEPVHETTCERMEEQLDALHALSRRGLWGIVLFMAVSAAALYGSSSGLFSLIPAEVREMVGEGPPPAALYLVLAVSWLSSFVLIIGRRGGDGQPGYCWYNVGLPTVFYPLAIFTQEAATLFPVVFVAGLILLLLEHFTVTSYASRAIRETTARLERIRKFQ